MSSTAEEAVLTDIQVWALKPVSDEPVYNAETDKMHYSQETVTIPKGGNLDFGVTLPAEDTYYVSYTVKTSGNFFFNYRGDTQTDSEKGRLLIGLKQYGIYGLKDGNQWPQYSKGTGVDSTGVKVTICSKADRTSIWANGEKILDEVEMKHTNMVVKPWVSSTAEEAVLTDIQVWAVKPVSDEPLYNAETYEMQFEAESVEIAASGKYDFGVTIAEDETYYISFIVQTDNEFYFDYRGTNKARLFISPAQYCPIGVNGTNTYVQEDVGLASGVKVTICSEPDKTSMWFNGEKVLENATLNESGAGVPKVTWVQNATNMTNIQIWTTPDALLKGTNATLDGSIGMNFFMGISDDTLASGDDVSMKFTVPGTAQQKVALSEATYNETQDAYVFTCNMAAKRMSEEITAQLFVGEEAVSEAYSYTIEEYAREIIGGDYTEAEKALAQNMLHYGAYSQLYLNHNPSVLPNVGLEALDMSSVTKDDIDVSKNVLTIAGLGSIVASNLSLKSETTLKMYFAPIEGVENLTFTYGNETLTTSDYTYTDGSKWICIAITNIAANELDDTLEIGVTDGTNTGTLKYSALTYGYNVLNMTSPKETLSNLVKALYYYNASANALLEASQE